jgi:hypothetical protein
VNEEALAHWGLLREIKKIKYYIGTQTIHSLNTGKRNRKQSRKHRDVIVRILHMQQENNLKKKWTQHMTWLK